MIEMMVVLRDGAYLQDDDFVQPNDMLTLTTKTQHVFRVIETEGIIILWLHDRMKIGDVRSMLGQDIAFAEALPEEGLLGMVGYGLTTSGHKLYNTHSRENPAMQHLNLFE